MMASKRADSFQTLCQYFSFSQEIFSFFWAAGSGETMSCSFCALAAVGGGVALTHGVDFIFVFHVFFLYLFFIMKLSVSSYRNFTNLSQDTIHNCSDQKQPFPAQVSLPGLANLCLLLRQWLHPHPVCHLACSQIVFLQEKYLYIFYNFFFL